MQLVFVLLIILLLAVALFAIQNADAVTVRFLHWQLQASLAVVTLAATATGAGIAVLLGWMARLRRWRKHRAADRLARRLPSEPTARPPSDPFVSGT
jgi:putative membrane protein